MEALLALLLLFHSIRKFSPFQHYPWLIGWPIHIWGDDSALCGSCPTWIVCFYMLNALKVMSALLFTNYLSELINILFQELLLWVFLTVRTQDHSSPDYCHIDREYQPQAWALPNTKHWGEFCPACNFFCQLLKCFQAHPWVLPPVDMVLYKMWTLKIWQRQSEF